uniref:Uncharacterized protein n=1 Tax=Neobodo designis TaxID=312471 RepID=A0A7S1KWK0_NEODS|mmetsp:Transcript_10339/g.31997  ORF Transcript_10339/g.31997 Transcript_10339/m.31997 type:complete len:184 (+) Transcript_10339:50-601(+)|eukprot:CAMPEP_0174855342 /NCGR_PEP_ID=MMETSP1114-20130205/33056_1 /TAXON_ID=312471 /ORGANISM="Neobodo designis, Strain CCAP 1951/1" /LENGTH=183 /DNA_ID=CAMNT_0016090081 /DNA_START=50 /DNA_END=601 /DNA_ORIENTATION=+
MAAFIDEDDDVGLLLKPRVTEAPAPTKRPRESACAADDRPRRNPAQGLKGARGDGIQKMSVLAFGCAPTTSDESACAPAVPPCDVQEPTEKAASPPAAAVEEPRTVPRVSAMSLSTRDDQGQGSNMLQAPAHVSEPTPPLSRKEVPAAKLTNERAKPKKAMEKAAAVTPKIDAFFAKFARKAS